MNTKVSFVCIVMLISNCASLKTGTGIPAGELHVRPIEIPAIKPGETVVYHTGFALVYDEEHEQARWVAYELTGEETKSGVERSSKFYPDPKVTTGTAAETDYKKSGYDRGHLAPAADMSWSVDAMKESFYYSNVSPQVPSFNRGIWKKLEERVREWARRDSSVYIVTGPVLQPGLPTIGTNAVSVPTYFYKVVLVFRNHKTGAIGLILPNQKSLRALATYAVPVDSVEQLTGIDFFPALPDDLEAKLESTVCLACWDWGPNP